MYNAYQLLGVELLTNVRRLDPVRRAMLADMGIEVWTLRKPSGVRESASGSAGETEPVAVPKMVVAPEPPQPPVPALPAGLQERTSTDTRSLAVTYLVSGSAVMLVDNGDTGISRRLCRDLLACAAGDWGSVAREIAFSWPGGGPQSDGWRAFRAFAEKQLSEVQAHVVLCDEGLAEQLTDLVGDDCELLVLPALGDLDVEAKRALWRRMQTLGQ